MKKFYIVGPGENGMGRGEGIYALIADDGEFMANHYCSHAFFAKNDLTDRAERIEKWKERFGEYQVIWLGEDDMTDDKLFKLFKACPANYSTEDKPVCKVEATVNG